MTDFDTPAARVELFLDRFVSDPSRGDAIYGLGKDVEGEPLMADLTVADVRSLVYAARELALKTQELRLLRGHLANLDTSPSYERLLDEYDERPARG